jgi:NhaA family Na+:H+ antiporter
MYTLGKLNKMIHVVTKPFKYFFKLESASGLVLLFAAIIALIISNSDYGTTYFTVLQKNITIGFGSFSLKLTIIHWINDVLMTIFFFLVSLEIKREIVQGELSNPKQALLPIIGAVGGMVVPAVIYILINLNSPETLKGWAIPSATDIAFSLGVLSLLGKRVPVSLKIFLTALAIIDDLGAIVIIAFFYSGNIQTFYLMLMLIAVVVLFILNKFNVRAFTPYLFIGILLWDFTHQSGIHATISGVLLALLIPHDKKNRSKSLLLKLEHGISKYVAFGIMPLFAFANAGVSLNGLSFNALLNPVPLGIVCGLFFGKQIGVFLFSYISVKLNFAQKPSNSNWLSLYAVSILTGIGFTMSLFVGNLAFVNSDSYMDGVKIGVLTGSLLSTLFGYFLLLLSTKND